MRVFGCLQPIIDYLTVADYEREKNKFPPPSMTREDLDDLHARSVKAMANIEKKLRKAGVEL